jgi:hypothetical protein
MSTRWFCDPQYGNWTSTYRTWVYFPNDRKRFIEVNNLYLPSLSSPAYYTSSSLPEIPMYSVVICDFNQRLIKRNYSANRQRPTSEVPPTTVHRCKDQANDPPISYSQSSSSSDLIAEDIISEEWVLGSTDFTEKVRSRLPFRVILRKKESNQIRTPNTRGNPFAFVMVSRSSSRYSLQPK